MYIHHFKEEVERRQEEEESGKAEGEVLLSMLPTYLIVLTFRIDQGLPKGPGHEVQDHSRSSRRHSGPRWRPDLSALLHLQGLYRDPERTRGGRDLG